MTVRTARADVVAVTRGLVSGGGAVAVIDRVVVVGELGHGERIRVCASWSPRSRDGFPHDEAVNEIRAAFIRILRDAGVPAGHGDVVCPGAACSESLRTARIIRVEHKDRADGIGSESSLIALKSCVISVLSGVIPAPVMTLDMLSRIKLIVSAGK
jgi:hypothetical protein